MRPFLLPIATAFLALSSLQTFAAGEVSIIDVQQNIPCEPVCSMQYEFKALVTNLGYQKQVFVHAKQAGVWIDIPLKFNRAATNNKEVWTGSIPVPFLTADKPKITEFAVKYQVNGKTYWDNNNGANYAFKLGSGLGLDAQLFNTQVAFGKSIPGFDGRGFYFEEIIFTKHAATPSQMKVIFSTDHWATTQVGFVESGPGHISPETDIWVMVVRSNLLPTESAHVDYAFSYTVNGKTYWDNNFGKNYQFDIPRFIK